MFVPDAIPGERVRVRLTDDAPKIAAFWRAEALEILDASPHRRPHVWRQADIDVPPEDRPGGADFGHIDLAHQRALKLEVLTDALQRIGGLDVVAGIVERRPRRWRTTSSMRRRGDAGRHGLAHAREPARRRRRPRRALRGAQPPRHRRSTTCRSRPPRSQRAALAPRVGEPGRIDLVQPADGRVRVIPPSPTARRSAAAAPAQHAIDARARGRRRARRRPRLPRRRRRVLAGAPARRALAHRCSSTASSATAPAARRSTPTPGTSTSTAASGSSPRRSATLGGAAHAGHDRRVRPARDRARRREPRRVGRRARRDGARRPVARADCGRGIRPRARAAVARRRACSTRRARAPAARSSRRSRPSHPAAVVYVACDPVALARDLAHLPRARATRPRGSTRSTCSRTRTMSKRSPSSLGAARRASLSGMTRVALIDDHESVRLGLEAACARAGKDVVFSGSTVTRVPRLAGVQRSRRPPTSWCSTSRSATARP